MNLISFVQVLYTDVECTGFTIPGKLAYIISLIVKLLQFGVPLLLIIFGMMDLGKAVIASKEDEIKKGQQMFIKRLISAVLVFFVVTVVILVIGLAAPEEEESDDVTITQCINQVVNYKDKKD